MDGCELVPGKVKGQTGPGGFLENLVLCSVWALFWKSELVPMWILVRAHASFCREAAPVNSRTVEMKENHTKGWFELYWMREKGFALWDTCDIPGDMGTTFDKFQ